MIRILGIERSYYQYIIKYFQVAKNSLCTFTCRFFKKKLHFIFVRI